MYRRQRRRPYRQSAEYYLRDQLLPEEWMIKRTGERVAWGCMGAFWLMFIAGGLFFASLFF